MPTPKGVALITILPEQLQSPLLTAEWEQRLKRIERGEESADAFLQDIRTMLTELKITAKPVKGAETLFPSQKESIGAWSALRKTGHRIRQGILLHQPWLSLCHLEGQ